MCLYMALWGLSWLLVAFLGVGPAFAGLCSAGLRWPELVCDRWGWAGLGQAGQCWARLGRAGLDWAGLVVLGWAGLGWAAAGLNRALRLSLLTYLQLVRNQCETSAVFVD